ncbi:iron complex transport system substrate-binding protein [Haloactinopolyspora alba]|uniref:Iron complex transport system substrate-binding protein n=1 Tax=Haloactinopolyspora alba TaxID=648780 RepID=A0A2P8E977_9ACTN|nr:iron-siderophore ABC transporter substrate-binding protein [Haloactinopolyspora alba]PSL06031.1 iron complex transport system substrate-binding protein [Haloactinopolyspora alba]
MHALTRRRRVRLLAALTLGVLVTGACGPADDTTASADGPASDPASAPAAGDAFPVTVEHALGETTIDSEPQRVVTWGWSSQDAALALGVVPVAMPAFEYGGDDEGVLPWTREALGDNETPTILPSNGQEIPYEAIAEADPDLILALNSGLDSTEYETLSQIAPTVAYPEKTWSTSWQDQARLAGEALGRTAQAEKLVADTEAYLDEKAAQYPQLDGKTFVYATEDDGQLGVYTSDDVRVSLLTDLGLEVAPYVDENATGDSFYYYVSGELAADIESDIMVAWFDDEATADDFASDPLFSQNPAIARGAFAPIVGESYVMASSAPTVLSIPWMLDDYVPQLAEAADASD